MENKTKNKIEWIDISERNSDLLKYAVVLYCKYTNTNYGFVITDMYGSVSVDLRFIHITEKFIFGEVDVSRLEYGHVVRTLSFDSVRQAKTRAKRIAIDLALI